MKSERHKDIWRIAALAAVCNLAAAGTAHPAAGDAAMEMLRLDIGPRQAAMGGAAVALGGDIYAAAYNPALLAGIDAQEAAFSNAQWIEGIAYQNGLYAHPLPWGGVCARIERLGYGEIQGYDAAGARSGEVAAQDLLAGFAFARRTPLPGLSVGGGFKLARETIGTVSATGYLFDLGAAWAPGDLGRLGDLGFGLALRNLGPSVRFDQEDEYVPTAAVLGLAGSLLREKVTWALDGNFPVRQAPFVGLGGELWASEHLALRAGFELPQDAGIGLRAGFGLRLGGLRLDYALSPLGDLGLAHHIGLGMRFGGPADRAYRAGMKHMRGGLPAEALLDFNEALRHDPGHRKASRGLRKAYQAIREDDGD